MCACTAICPTELIVYRISMLCAWTFVCDSNALQSEIRNASCVVLLFGDYSSSYSECAH